MAATAEGRRAVELACFEEMQRQAYGSTVLEKDGAIIHDVRLEGAYPTTRPSEFPP